jgi:outer membrane receptor protein involved in Fe transport
MKPNFRFAPSPFARRGIPLVRQRTYWMAISLASLACGSTALAQSNTQTNTPPATGSSGASTNATRLGNVTVSEKLDVARNKIATDIGATDYRITTQQIETQSQGENASFKDVLLRTPGVSQDSAASGSLHVRNEHAFVQYRINDVILPEGITGFSSELDTRFIGSLDLLTGTLPAEYGQRTAGVVDIHTKSGAFNQGGDFSVFGGSYDTIHPGFQYGGRDGNLNYYFSGSYLHTSLGIENPTPSDNPIHDKSDQYRGLTYLSYILDDTSRISLILSGDRNFFQIPNNPDQAQGTDGAGNPFPVPGTPTFDSASLNENQTENNYYGVVAYQKSVGDLNLQLAGFSRYSSVLFRPDYNGDLFFNGVASRVDREIFTQGFQADASYDLDESHTLRGGAQLAASKTLSYTTTAVFPEDNTGAVNGPPESIVDNHTKWGYQGGVYAQDEWKLTQKWTVNYGLRFDLTDAFITQYEFQPRVNTVFKPTEKLTLHAGYARYFTPPPLEGVQQNTLGKFAGTSNQSPNQQFTPVFAERSHYFDIGASQVVAPGLTLGVDAYYKIANQQLDDGQFGQALIVTPFNYRDGKLYGAELSATYKLDGFSLYGNFSAGQEKARNIDSAQFNFSPGDLAYIKDHYIFTDHSQTFTGSAGASYTWRNTTVLADLIYGNGVRQSIVNPNDSRVPAYTTINFGIEHDFKLGGNNHLRARFDVVNLFDEVYQLRSGTGIGVGAPQFGARRGFYGTLSYVF